MSNIKPQTIGIGWDGTLSYNTFPKTTEVFQTARRIVFRLHNAGHKIMLLTEREGKELHDAMEQFDKNTGIPLHGVTKHSHAGCDLYIDSISLGIPLLHVPADSEKPFVDWLEVEKMLEKRGLL